MNRAHRLKASDEAGEAFKALPESFDAVFTIAFAPEKAAEHGDAADHLAYGGRLFEALSRPRARLLVIRAGQILLRQAGRVEPAPAA